MSQLLFQLVLEAFFLSLKEGEKEKENHKEVFNLEISLSAFSFLTMVVTW